MQPLFQELSHLHNLELVREALFPLIIRFLLALSLLHLMARQSILLLLPVSMQIQLDFQEF